MNQSSIHGSVSALLAMTVFLVGACTQSHDEPASTESAGLKVQSPSPTIATENHDLIKASESISRLRHSPQSKLRQAEFLMPLPVIPENRERYAEQQRNQTIRVADEPVSTFSVDVDTGSYANTRRILSNGQLPPEDAVRIEEFLNYFDYHYAASSSADTPFSVTTALGKTPWNDKTQLLHIGLKGYEPPDNDILPANLVFLIDVSGSMQSPDKLGLLKSSISLLTQELAETDTVSIVVYAGSSGLILKPTAGDQHQTIINALSQLQAGGSTHGAEGIQLAYQVASEAFKPKGINRIILATDGDFNVGISDIEQLKSLIRKQRESGIALTTLGFGTGNYNDYLMEQLADAGNGAYAYIDTLSEARKVLVDELRATLMTIAKDVKIQIEFNPAVVSEYRLIGYSNRLLNNEDFSNDRVDAGEIGAGHTVTALYEIALHGSGGERHTPRRYGTQAAKAKSAELAEIRLRYKLPDAENSLLSTSVIELAGSAADTDSTRAEVFEFSASVAAFGQLLAGDTRIGDFNFSDTRSLAAGALGEDRFGYRAEFLRLVDLAESLHRLSLKSTPLDPDSDKG